MREQFFDIRSIHFRQFWATLVFVDRKAPPTQIGWGEIFLTPDLSISGNFEQLWFLWQKSPPPPIGWGEIFWHQIYPFQAILSNFDFCDRKATPHPNRMREIFLTPDLSISGNFEQLWFLWQKSPPPRMRENFLTSDLSISGNFEQLWFLWQKSPPSQDEGKFFDTRSIHFRQFWATLIFVTEKPPTPIGWGKFFWHQIYPFQAILSNFGFCDRKAPLPGWGEIFWHQIYPIQAILSNFGFCGRKATNPLRMREHFFDTRSIHFRQFWATLVFVAEKPTRRMRGNFWHQIYPFQAILSNFGFCGRKAPPTLPGWGKIFWHQIYPFQAILSNFGFCGRKAPLPLFSLFVRDWARITLVEYPRSPYYKSILRFLLSEYLL